MTQSLRPDLSLAIVNHNGRAFLDPLLSSIDEHKGRLRLEVLVADNASTDGSVEMIRERYPWALLTANAEDLYFIRATNQNLRRAKGRYLMLLNEDTRIPSSTLEGMVAYLDTHPEVGALGPQLRNFDGTLQPTCNRFPTVPYAVFQYLFLHTLFPNNPVRRWNTYAGWDRATLREVDAISGEGMTVRREVLERVGLLDETTRMYNEEVDWCYRIRQAGWKVVYHAEFILFHYGAGTTRKDPPWEIYEMLHESFLHFYKKAYGWPVYVFLKSLYTISTVALRFKRHLQRRERKV